MHSLSYLAQSRSDNGQFWFPLATGRVVAVTGNGEERLDYSGNSSIAHGSELISTPYS